MKISIAYNNIFEINSCFDFTTRTLHYVPREKKNSVISITPRLTRLQSQCVNLMNYSANYCGFLHIHQISPRDWYLLPNMEQCWSEILVNAMLDLISDCLAQPQRQELSLLQILHIVTLWRNSLFEKKMTFLEKKTL